MSKVSVIIPSYNHEKYIGEAIKSVLDQDYQNFEIIIRDCWCDTGMDNTCGKRFKWQFGELPYGYDHKYTYTQVGFNVKLTDFQAAIGVAQLKKVPTFIKKRKENYQKLHHFFSQYPEYFSLIQLSDREDPCWFGFPILVKKDAPFSRNDLTEYLEKNKIGTRNVFAGNLLHHPAYLNLKRKRIIGKLKNADMVMNQAFWLGVFPGIKNPQMNYVLSKVREYLSRY